MVVGFKVVTTGELVVVLRGVEVVVVGAAVVVVEVVEDKTTVGEGVVGAAVAFSWAVED